MFNQDDLIEKELVDLTLLRQGNYTISYDDVKVDPATLAELKALQKQAPMKGKYPRYLQWLYYANLNRWQKQGYHFSYEDFNGSLSCTCGLTLHSADAVVEEDVVQMPAEFVSTLIADKFEELDLDHVQYVKGHRRLPTCADNAVALIIKFKWHDSTGKYLWNAICQECGEQQIQVLAGAAKAFVRAHNKNCSISSKEGK